MLLPSSFHFSQFGQILFVVAAIGMACGAGLYLEAALASVMALFALRLIGVMQSILPWKQCALLYEVRGPDRQQLYTAVLAVPDRAPMRMNFIDKDSLCTLKRITFALPANQLRHQSLLRELRASDRTGQVLAFEDADQD